MKRRLRLTRRRAAAGAGGLALLGSAAQPAALGRAQSLPVLDSRLLAVGIPGAGAISAVGAFLPGGPIRDNAAFAAYTESGRILDPGRVLVCSESQFGAPRAVLDWPDGSVLSIAPGAAGPLVVPRTFAASDGQMTALDGQVQLFTAQSPAFFNAVYNPTAATAIMPAVSHPQGISINNAFGRLWFPNTPLGPQGDGFDSIIDPDGRPLRNAPSATAGGVFSGSITNRAPEQLVPGDLRTAAVGNAFLGPSPDGSGRAVFAVATANGAVAQIHSEKGVDGLAPGGTIGPLEQIEPGLVESVRPVATRLGMAFNWVPNAILYVTDPLRHEIVALTLIEDGQVFRVGSTRRLADPMLTVPVDIAPTVPETVSPVFSSNTTLAGGADLYVANRGDGTVVRLSQDGRVLAVRQVQVPGLGALGAGRLNGIAISPNGQRLWMTVSGPIPGYPGLDGAVVEAPAFGAA
jgi:hypothetical protein